MATITYRWTGDGIARMEMALSQLESMGRRQAAFRRALNHTGDKVYTRVRRALARQMGLANQSLLKNGRGLRKVRAAGGRMEYQIVSSGRAVRAKEFRHNVGKKGVTFYPWGNRKFIKSGFVIKAYSGNFYRRRTSARFPLEALYGPNINKELVKDASAAAFHATVAAALPARVEHEVRVITNGVIS